MQQVFAMYDRAVALASNCKLQNLTLLFTRIVLAGVFWRSGRTKVDEGSWFLISDNTRFLFQEEYKGVPLPSDLAAVMATVSEHLFPVLLVLGLFTRLSALALLGMTLVIQIFVYPEAWWQVHSLWVAMALVLIVRGGGSISLDAPLVRRRTA
ncbi:DoxX family protein [Sphingopyxis sp. GW247-27LB]|uniref:DoxX family protein n=2 Tax=unclassified Sphingopyxis TaxID=2614943 RepID=UPI000BA592C6|nr:DoxX family protein [Sphingopyxis sp. GW247-27LB]PAL19836.1 DoxX protein [Sphingopyxis sp. GW247-27LB]